MKEVVFVGWDLTKEETELLDRIKEYFINLTDNKLTVKIEDLKVFGEKTYASSCIIFGNVANQYVVASKYKKWLVSEPKRMLPDYDDYLAYKKKTFDVLQEASVAILKASKEEPISVHIETPEGITVGPDGCQINITESEAEHLKTIRDILGGGKMVITKGDLRIEVG
jgi:hypothetical protein